MTQVLRYLDDLSPEAARRWIAAALAEAAALRAHDDDLFPKVDDPASVEKANHLHDAWRQWADDADALLKRTGSQPNADVPELADAVGRARAMLEITPRQHLDALEQVRSGQVVSAEEVRRELRHRAGGSGPSHFSHA